MKKNKILLGSPLINDSQQKDSRELFSSSGRSSIIVSRGNDFLNFDAEGHLISIAPTGAGKGRSSIVPNLLTYKGPVIVIDPKGENYFITADARRKMGQKVILLDPFSLINDTNSDCFNPFDILPFTGKTVNDEVRSIIDIILADQPKLQTDQFYDNAAKNLIVGLALYMVTNLDVDSRNLGVLRKFLVNDDPIYNIAVVLDTLGKKMNQEAYEELAVFLQSTESTRSHISLIAQQYFKTFGSPSIQEAINKTTFNLDSIVEGENFSVYIVIPPTKIMSHQTLFKIWLSALLSLISTRKFIPKSRTLLFLDEMAQLGHLGIFEIASTFFRGYGLTVWSFWQDLSQLKRLYPDSWESILNNCSIIQIFGFKNYYVSKEFAELLGINPIDIKDIANDEQILSINNELPILAKRLDYLSDNEFKDKFNPNPFYSLINIS